MITIADLKQVVLKHPNAILFCRHCGAICSANPQDYFWVADRYPFFCCDRPMMLATRKIVFEEIKL